MDKEAKAAMEKELGPKNLFLNFLPSFLNSMHSCVPKTGLLDLNNHLWFIKETSGSNVACELKLTGLRAHSLWNTAHFTGILYLNKSHIPRISSNIKMPKPDI